MDKEKGPARAGHFSWGHQETVSLSALFALGEACGDAHDDVITLWTRYEGTDHLTLVVRRMAAGAPGDDHEVDNGWN